MSNGASPLICPAKEGARLRNYPIWIDSKRASLCEWVLLHCFDGGSCTATSPGGRSVDQIDRACWEMCTADSQLRCKVIFLGIHFFSPARRNTSIPDSGFSRAKYVPEFTGSPPKIHFTWIPFLAEFILKRYATTLFYFILPSSLS